MGINYFIFVSATVFGLGLLTIIIAKGAMRSLAGISMMFFSSVINIAAFGGFWGFNPESQILLFLVTAICLIHLAAGALLFYKDHREKIINTPHE